MRRNRSGGSDRRQEPRPLRWPDRQSQPRTRHRQNWEPVFTVSWECPMNSSDLTSEQAAVLIAATQRYLRHLRRLKERMDTSRTSRTMTACRMRPAKFSHTSRLTRSSWTNSSSGSKRQSRLTAGSCRTPDGGSGIATFRPRKTETCSRPSPLQQKAGVDQGSAPAGVSCGDARTADDRCITHRHRAGLAPSKSPNCPHNRQIRHRLPGSPHLRRRRLSTTVTPPIRFSSISKRVRYRAGKRAFYEAHILCGVAETLRSCYGKLRTRSRPNRRKCTAGALSSSPAADREC